MANWRKAASSASSRLRRRGTQFYSDLAGIAGIEFAILLPVVLSMLTLIVFAGQGFEINRKITMVVRTLTDLATQQTNIGTSSSTYTYTQILNAASLVIAPYDSSQLSMVLSEISANGLGNGTVVWSQANANGTALTVGSTVSVPTNITASGYLILGATSYNYSPLGSFFQFPLTSFPITDSLYLAPRAGSSVSCCS